MEPPYVGCYKRFKGSGLRHAGSLSGFGRLFVISDFGADVIDFDEEPDGVVRAIAILAGSVF